MHSTLPCKELIDLELTSVILLEQNLNLFFMDNAEVSCPEELIRALKDFVQCYNHQRSYVDYDLRKVEALDFAIDVSRSSYWQKA